MFARIGLLSGIVSWLLVIGSVLFPGAISNVGLLGMLSALIATVCGVIAMRSGDRHGLAGFCLGSLHLTLIMIVLILMALTGA
jgi:hypothetical protein